MVMKRLNERIGSGEENVLNDIQMTRKLVLYILGENVEQADNFTEIPQEFEKYWDNDLEIFTYFKGKMFLNLDLSNINFTKVDFTGAKFISVNFRDSNFEDAQLVNVNATNCNFDNIHMNYAYIEDSVFNDCTFNNSVLPEYFKRQLSV